MRDIQLSGHNSNLVLGHIQFDIDSFILTLSLEVNIISITDKSGWATSGNLRSLWLTSTFTISLDGLQN